MELVSVAAVGTSAAADSLIEESAITGLGNIKEVEHIITRFHIVKLIKLFKYCFEYLIQSFQVHSCS